MGTHRKKLFLNKESPIPCPFCNQALPDRPISTRSRKQLKKALWDIWDWEHDISTLCCWTNDRCECCINDAIFICLLPLLRRYSVFKRCHLILASVSTLTATFVCVGFRMNIEIKNEGIIACLILGSIIWPSVSSIICCVWDDTYQCCDKTSIARAMQNVERRSARPEAVAGIPMSLLR